MRAIKVDPSTSAPVLVDIACPTPGPGEVLIKVESCGLNFADLLILKGEYQDMPPPPGILGLEVAGRIDSVGPDVSGFRPGQRVAAVGSYGGLAEYAVYPVENTSAIPDTMSADDAAALQVAYGTSHVALGHRARLQAGN